MILKQRHTTNMSPHHHQRTRLRVNNSVFILILKVWPLWQTVRKKAKQQNFARCCKALQFFEISQLLSFKVQVFFIWNPLRSPKYCIAGYSKTCLFCIGTEGDFHLLVLLHDAFNLIGCRQRHSLIKLVWGLLSYRCSQ